MLTYKATFESDGRDDARLVWRTICEVSRDGAKLGSFTGLLADEEVDFMMANDRRTANVWKAAAALALGVVVRDLIEARELGDPWGNEPQEAVLHAHQLAGVARDVEGRTWSAGDLLVTFDA